MELEIVVRALLPMMALLLLLLLVMTTMLRMEDEARRSARQCCPILSLFHIRVSRHNVRLLFFSHYSGISIVSSFALHNL